MKIARHKTKIIKIGNIAIGGNNPIAIQSMLKSKASDTENSIRQIKRLKDAGCDIVRLAIKDVSDAKSIKKIKQRVAIPLVADIHFNWQLALEVIDNGIDKIRLNPGNIYKKEQIKEIVKAAKLAKIPIRVGVNSGSLPKTIGYRLKARGHRPKTKDIAQEMCQSTLDYIKILEGFKFYDIVVSLKASNIFDTMQAYRLIGRACNYPLHLGLTATGLPYKGAIKSSIAIGALLLEGIGDTIRVSLTDSSEEEIKVARAILEALNLRNFGPQIISCPTCGRCEVDLQKLAGDFESKLDAINYQLSTINSRPLRVALMGCVVNGPGESRAADIGIAFGKKEGLLFKHGKPIKKVPFNRCVDVLLKEIGCFGQRHLSQL